MNFDKLHEIFEYKIRFNLYTFILNIMQLDHNIYNNNDDNKLSLSVFKKIDELWEVFAIAIGAGVFVVILVIFVLIPFTKKRVEGNYYKNKNHSRKYLPNYAHKLLASPFSRKVLNRNIRI